jgi:hypothetical protein
MSDLVTIITSRDAAVRNRSLDGFCRHASAAALVDAAAQLDAFRRASENLYERVRAIFFLSAIYRYHLPPKLPVEARSAVPYDGYLHLLSRRFEEAVESFLAVQSRDGPSDAIASALAAAWVKPGIVKTASTRTTIEKTRHRTRRTRNNDMTTSSPKALPIGFVTGRHSF